MCKNRLKMMKANTDQKMSGHYKSPVGDCQSCLEVTEQHKHANSVTLPGSDCLMCHFVSFFLYIYAHSWVQ